MGTDARILLSKRRRHDSSTRSLSTRRSFTICDMHATTICATLLLALTTPLVLGGAQAASSEPFVAHRMIQRRRTGHDVNVVQRAAMPSPPASRIGAVALEPRGEGGQHPKALFIKCNGSDKYELCDTQYCIDMGTTPAETKCYEGQIIWADGGDVNDDYSKVVALDTRRFGPTWKSPDCGRTVKITNTDNGKTVLAKVADACPTCKNYNSLDLSVGAFEAIGHRDTGVLPIKWHFVD